jgi:hypothetical protein
MNFFLVQILTARINLNEIKLTTLLQGGFEKITLQLCKIEIKINFLNPFTQFYYSFTNR